MTLYQYLNPQQRAAVEAPLENAIILSGAGSGKTTTLISRIDYLIQKYSIQPHNILAVTFTNASAKELKERLLLNDTETKGLTTGTFHSIALRMLKEHWIESGFLSKDFAVLDNSDQERFVKNVLKKHNMNAKDYKISDILMLINTSKEQGIRAHAVTEDFAGTLYKYKNIYMFYEQECLKENVADFSELLLRCVEMLEGIPSICNHYHNKYQCIFIDEFQDINAIQFKWFNLLKSHKNIFFLVGDDDQSIYSFRGASPLFFEKTIKMYSPHIFKLEHNYRSTQNIIQASNQLIAKNKYRQSKTLFSNKMSEIKPMVIQCIDDSHEAKSIAQMIGMYFKQGIAYQDMAVIYRMHHQSRLIEEQLIRAKIPYIMRSGTRFFEREEIKHIIAYLQLSINENNQFFLSRVINVPARGIGDVMWAKWTSLQTSTGELPRAAANHLGPKEFKAISSFYRFLDSIPHNQCFIDKIKYIIHESGIYKYYENEPERQDNLLELINAAINFESEYQGDDIVSDFLDYAVLNSKEDNEVQGVNLMTIHGSKGLEFDVVFGPGLDDDILPSSRATTLVAIEEERRLAYVLMTRAKSHLLLLSAKQRMIFGRTERMRVSPFIRDIPKTMYEKIGK